MEITLEKVELVKDRTGVSYKDAKEALEATDGNVVDAIIGIEETINLSGTGKVSEQAKQIIDSIKDAVNKGNISKIRISTEDDVLLNLPVNIGIVGTVLAPWAAIIGTLAAFITKCKIELIKDDGGIIDISEKAGDKIGDIADRGSDFADVVKEKGAQVYDSAKNKVHDVTSKTKKSGHIKDDFKDTVDEMWEEAKRRVEQAEDSASGVKDDVEETVSDAEEALKEAAEKVTKKTKKVKRAVEGEA
ncbi:MAG: DUF4342 domain-containing protein [Clostridiales Family XIII bacterium]|jgi:gas vesicle protein|nr:DUF4342 domain-containing protein [Clostridiales Family XIII bacterium]